MEKLTKYLGPHVLNTVIAGSFSPVDLNRCSRLPVAELEAYEKLVTWFPKHQTFIAGGFASFVMGYTTDFSDINLYVICESSDDARKVHRQIEERTSNMRVGPRWTIGLERCWLGRIKCEEYGLFVYRIDDDGVNNFDMMFDIGICVVPQQPHVGEFRYIDILKVVCFFDMFQSMCIIDSVDLPGKQCSALAIHQFQQAVADTDTRSLLAIQKRRDCLAAVEKRTLKETELLRTPKTMFWEYVAERCARYKRKTQRPNLKIGVPRLSSICLSELLGKTPDFVTFHQNGFDTHTSNIFW